MVTSVIVLLVAAAAAWMHRVLRRRAWRNGPHYVAHIQTLKTSTPLALPAIQPLRAVVAKKTRKRKSLKPPIALARTGTK